MFPMPPRVLLIDDDVELSALLLEYLEQERFVVRAEVDGSSGVAAALSGEHDIVVLDVMLPYLGGIDALRRIRASSSVPVLMLTARGDDVDRVVGLELGADDYVPKPCTPRELVARIRAILRRVQARDKESASAPAVIEVGPFVLWTARRRLERERHLLELTGTEFNLLAVLMRRAGSVVGKNDLSELALDRPLARFDRSIDVHVTRLRQKLGCTLEGRSWIQTVRGQGYLFISESA
jgi:two-component system, OmpR family, response regulator